MNIDMSEVNNMLLDYEEEARQSKSAANEIVEETLRALGYSKRDKNSVRKLFKQQLDWLVKANDIVTGIAVNKLDTDLTAVATESLFDQALDVNANVLIITDSKTYNVFRHIEKNKKQTYTEIDSIDITSMNNKNIKVLNAISFDNADIKVLDSLLSERTLTKEETMKLFNEYIDSRKSDIVAFVSERKASCLSDDIEKNIIELAQVISKSMLTPDEIRVNYEQAEKKYIDALTSKNTEIHTLNRQIEELTEKNAELQHEVDVLSKKDYKYAVETLEFIAKNSGDNSKRFAGYINDEIYTSSKLHKFVGEMLQRLYAIKAVEAHAYIFDGNYFRLNNMNAKNNDMVIKNTVYDVMVSDDEADDALIRLRAIYSHFPDIIFACMETGFGNRKHNTGIKDEMLEMNEEYDTCDEELEIISSDKKKDIVKPEDTADTLEPVVDDSAEIDTQDTQDVSEEQTELDETQSDETQSDETNNIYDLIINHIVELEYSESATLKYVDELNVPEYSLLVSNSEHEIGTNEQYVQNENIETSVNGIVTDIEFNEDGAEDNEILDATDTADIAVINDTEKTVSDGVTDDIEEIDESEDIKESAYSANEVASEFVDDAVEELDSDIEEIDESDEQEMNNIEAIDDSNTSESNANVFNVPISDGNNDNIDENFEEQEYIEDTEEYVENGQYVEDEQAIEPILIVTALSAANSLVSDYVDDIEFNNIEAITAEEVAFNVNSDYEDLTYDELLVKSLNAVLAIDIYSDLNSKVVTKLKHKRLDELSDFIQVKSADLAEFPSIAGTKYVVCGIENINDLVYTLTRICQAIEIDIDKVYMFMTITTDSDVIKDNFGTTFDSIQFRNTDEEYKQGEVENTTISLIRGELFNNLLVTGASIKAYEDIFKRVLGVKTPYMELNIDGNNYTSLDAISYMIREAEKENVDLSNARFGAVFGERHKLISFDIDEVGDDPCEIELYSGDIIYCASLTEWQSVVSLIRIHNTLFKNSPIIVKTQIDMDAVNFYGSAYDTEVATDSLAICGLAHYVRTHFPQRQG